MGGGYEAVALRYRKSLLAKYRKVARKRWKKIGRVGSNNNEAFKELTNDVCQRPNYRVTRNLSHVDQHEAT